ncbi:hypothetical protein [Carboxylicivirga sp. RSCT41]|uniref:hypothetical protein n=1 Tax=Carboxylicivirga agarovorans TaxID=3417570 RepID=UPI003D3317FA
MRTLICLLILIAFSLNAFSQKVDENKLLYERKVQQYTKMKKTGATLGIIGGGLTAIGIALVASADWEEEVDEYGYTTTTTDTSGTIGILSLSAGIPMAVTGIVLSSVGNRKLKEYSEKLENVNVGYFKSGQQKGITLAITF